MKRSAFFISFSVLAHLSVIDAMYLLLSHEMVINYLVITYNFIWILIALTIWYSNYQESRD